MKKININPKVFKIIKYALTAVLGLAVAYLLYGIFASLYVWTTQPRFVLADGTKTVSWGFLVQLFIFLGILVVILLASGAVAVFFYILPYRRTKKAAVENSQTSDQAQATVEPIEFESEVPLEDPPSQTSVENLKTAINTLSDEKIDKAE